MRLMKWTGSILKFAGLEERAAYLKQALGKKMLRRLAESYQAQASEDNVSKVIYALSKADPTGDAGVDPRTRGKYLYLEWLAKRFAENDLRFTQDLGTFEDFQKAQKSTLRHFTNSNVLPPINNYKSMGELLSDVAPKNVSKIQEQQLLNKALKTGAAKIVVDDPQLRVVEVSYKLPSDYLIPQLPAPQKENETENERESRVNPHLRNACKAARELGSNTQWCTTAIEMSATYLKEAPLYVVYEAGAKVGQLHLPSGQFMDVNDSPIKFAYEYDSEEEEEENSATDTQLSNVTANWLRGFLNKSPSGIVMRAEMDDYRQYTDEEIKLLRTDPYAAVRFAMIRKYKAENIGVEAAKDSKDPQLAVKFCLALRKKFPALEEMIVTDQKATETYVNSFGNNLFQENEPVFSDPKNEHKARLQLSTSGSPDIIVGFAINSGKRWDRAEQALGELSNSSSASQVIRYAEKFGDSKLTRDTLLRLVAKDSTAPYYIVRYVSTTGIGRWPEAEPLLSESPKEMKDYATATNSHDLIDKHGHADEREFISGWFPKIGSYDKGALPKRSRQRSAHVEAWLMQNGTYDQFTSYLSGIKDPWPEGVTKLQALGNRYYGMGKPEYLTRLPAGDPHRMAKDAETGDLFDPYPNYGPKETVASWVRGQIRA